MSVGAVYIYCRCDVGWSDLRTAPSAITFSHPSRRCEVSLQAPASERTRATCKLENAGKLYTRRGLWGSSDAPSRPNIGETYGRMNLQRESGRPDTDAGKFRRVAGALIESDTGADFILG